MNLDADEIPEDDPEENPELDALPEENEAPALPELIDCPAKDDPAFAEPPRDELPRTTELPPEEISALLLNPEVDALVEENLEPDADPEEIPLDKEADDTPPMLVEAGIPELKQPAQSGPSPLFLTNEAAFIELPIDAPPLVIELPPAENPELAFDPEENLEADEPLDDDEPAVNLEPDEVLEPLDPELNLDPDVNLEAPELPELADCPTNDELPPEETPPLTLEPLDPEVNLEAEEPDEEDPEVNLEAEPDEEDPDKNLDPEEDPALRDDPKFAPDEKQPAHN